MRALQWQTPRTSAWLGASSQLYWINVLINYLDLQEIHVNHMKPPPYEVTVLVERGQYLLVMQGRTGPGIFYKRPPITHLYFSYLYCWCIGYFIFWVFFFFSPSLSTHYKYFFFHMASKLSCFILNRWVLFHCMTVRWFS